jgi:hypothetical protein
VRIEKCDCLKSEKEADDRCKKVEEERFLLEIIRKEKN